MRDLTRVPKAELVQAAAQAVRDEGGRIEGYLADDRTAELLGGSMDDARSMGVQSKNFHREFTAAQRKWSGRVRRALASLAESGEVIKVGNGQRTPGGSLATGTVYYYTPQEHQAERARAEDGNRQAAEIERRWGEVRRRLQEGPGITMGSRAGTIPLAGWEELLGKAGW